MNIIDGAMVTRIDIHLSPEGAHNTAATVVYERTALQAELNEHIKTLAKEDSDSGTHWESAINRYLETQSHQTR